MRFVSVLSSQFRNLEASAVEVDASRVLLVGENGQGKTNFLEAIYVLCYGSSFKAGQTKEMIAHGQKEFLLKAEVKTDDGDIRKLEYRFSDGHRTVTIDEREIRDRKELIYHIPCIVFSHDDIGFVRGEPELRRRFFDQTMSMYNPVFFDDLRRYRTVLRQRNAAIKDQRYALLPIYNQQLAAYGIEIQKEREKTIEEFNALFPVYYQKISGTDKKLKVSYRPSWNDCLNKEDIIKKLEETFERDIHMQTTSSGVHRDRFIISDEYGAFSLSGSTGQLRLASLILRIAQTDFFRKKTGKDPILLIDDVLLELDATKRNLLLEHLEGYSQAFFTFLPDEQILSKIDRNQTLVYRVQEGSFIPYE